MTDTVTLWNVASYGWTCRSEFVSGLTTVSTWTRDEQVLVLIYLGECEVQAAVLDGAPMPLDLLLPSVAQDGRLSDDATLFDRAIFRVSGRDDRVSCEQRALFESARKITLSTVPASIGGPSLPLSMRAALRNLALAVLSTPER